MQGPSELSRISWVRPLGSACFEPTTLRIQGNCLGQLVGRHWTPFTNQFETPFVHSACRVIKTEASGNFQFGAPAEIIKELMRGNIGVPHILVLPVTLTRERELLCEPEFFLYHNVFFQKSKLKVVGTATQIASIRTIMQESFFGPEESAVQRFSHLETMGYFPKEMLHFRKGLSFVLKAMDPDRDPAKLPVLDDFFDFIVCEEGQKVLFKDGKPVGPAEKDFDVVLSQTEKGLWVIGEPAQKRSTEIDTSLFTPASRPASEFGSTRFEAPDFGITFLGTGHGFAAGKRTTSFVAWAGGRGILVDSMADTVGALHRYGVHEAQIYAYIATHRHADHDAGAIRMLLDGKRITMITTRIIYESFMRSCEAYGVANAKHFVDFIEVKPGHILNGEKIGIPGLTLEFDSSFHSIPTLRFIACYDSGHETKSFYYSADTYYDPPALEKLFAQGLFTPERYQSLLNFGWNADVIVHEAGIAPIHTPQAVLEAKAREINRPFHLVHTARADDGITLPVATEGSTITFIERPAANIQRSYEAIDSNALLRFLPFHLAHEIARQGRVKTYPKDSQIIRPGSRGKSFYLILSGAVNVTTEGGNEALLGVGHYFGEEALLRGMRSRAGIQAATETVLLEVSRGLFSKIVSEFPAVRGAMERSLSLRPSLSKVEIFKFIPTEIIDLLAQSATEHAFANATNIISQGETGDDLFIIKSGQVGVYVAWGKEQKMRVAGLGVGQVFGEHALLNDSPRTATVQAESDVVVYRISRAEFLRIAKNSPALEFFMSQLDTSRQEMTKDALQA